MQELGGTLVFLAIVVAPIVLGILLAYGIMQKRRRSRPTMDARSVDGPATEPRDRTTDVGSGRGTP